MGVNRIAGKIIHEIRFENNRFVRHIKRKESQGVLQDGFKLRRVLINVKDGYSRASELSVVEVIFRQQKWKRNGSARRQSGSSGEKVAASENHSLTPNAVKLSG